MMRRCLVLLIIVVVQWPGAIAQRGGRIAPGGPGADAHWPTAAKNGLGTSATTTSKVWFTLAEGVLTEVFYPRLDVPNVQCLQLVIVTSEGVETELENTTHQLELVNARSLTYRQINKARTNKYTVTKTYTTDPESDALLIDIAFVSSVPAKVYVYYDPSINNSGMHDTGWLKNDVLLASDGSVASALMSDHGLASASNGFLGVNDGLTELRKSAGAGGLYERAENGNVVQFAELFASPVQQAHCTLALGFGASAQAASINARRSLGRGFTKIELTYDREWEHYVARLPTVGPTYQQQFNRSAMVLHALEDKTNRGATIASPSIPWGGGPNANESTISGYHAVWARDLYHVATALLALGDTDGANRALDYLFNVQQKGDGSFPQNSWLNGKSIGSGLQMDQVALPIVLAYQLRRADRITWQKHLKPAADFIVSHGPATGQDRWEEKSGYSPATIAAEIAGLVCAADVARLNRDAQSAALYLKTADEWVKKAEQWCVVSSAVNKSRYYLRISANDDPNDGAKIEINSGGGTFDERMIVDAGFLELVRLGIKSANDPLIVSSLKIIDDTIKVESRSFVGWYRYNHDAYGERPDGKPYDGKYGVGRLWTLLNGERGEYELARGNKDGAGRLLDSMLRFANDGGMIAEQVWDREDSPSTEFSLGHGTGSATPLAWSMAQFVRLAVNLKQGRNIETPEVVLKRYQ